MSRERLSIETDVMLVLCLDPAADLRPGRPAGCRESVAVARLEEGDRGRRALCGAAAMAYGNGRHWPQAGRR